MHLLFIKLQQLLDLPLDDLPEGPCLAFPLKQKRGNLSPIREDILWLADVKGLRELARTSVRGEREGES